MAKKADKASRAEVIAIHKRLEEVITKLDGGMCCYPAGIDDGTIAEELKVSRSSVGGLRLEIFGRLRTHAAPVAGDDPRIDELVRVNENLVTCITELKDRFNKLVLMLAIARIVDCRHLEIRAVNVAKT